MFLQFFVKDWAKTEDVYAVALFFLFCLFLFGVLFFPKVLSAKVTIWASML